MNNKDISIIMLCIVCMVLVAVGIVAIHKQRMTERENAMLRDRMEIQANCINAAANLIVPCMEEYDGDDEFEDFMGDYMYLTNTNNN